MTTTTDPTTAVLTHLNPTPRVIPSVDGKIALLDCACGAAFEAALSETRTAPDGKRLRGRELVRHLHAEHVVDVITALAAQEADATAGPLSEEVTRAVPALDTRAYGRPVGQRIADFAQEHGLNPGWHEPDNSGVGARVIGNHLDNAFGAQAGRSVSHDGQDFTEFNVVLTVEDSKGVPQDAAVINLASLLAIAARAI